MKDAIIQFIAMMEATMPVGGENYPCKYIIQQPEYNALKASIEDEPTPDFDTCTKQELIDVVNTLNRGKPVNLGNKQIDFGVLGDKPDAGWFQKQADLATKSIEERPDFLKPEAVDDVEAWITWGGGECPVDGDTLLDVHFRGGNGQNVHASELLGWSHSGKTGDIVAYKIVEENKPVKQTLSDWYTKLPCPNLSPECHSTLNVISLYLEREDS